MPGWENKDDDSQTYSATISAIIIIAREDKEDIGLKFTLLEGGVGHDHAIFDVKSWDSGIGRENDHVTIVVFGQ